MIFLVVTHVDHIVDNDKYYGYAPYVKEMNIWSQQVDKLVIVAPVSNKKLSAIYSDYTNKKILFFKIPAISTTSLFEIIRSIVFLPRIGFQIFSAMRKADHIHLRCPGNIGLIGCMVQVFFPKKPKTAKYAGNWDPKAKQPLSYRLQKWVLGNTFWTKNMKVLVYGEWSNQSKNILPFFTASYHKEKIKESKQREITSPFQFVFVGSLSAGKRPLYAVKLIEELNSKGFDCTMEVYGDGDERESLADYLRKNNLEDAIKLHGNQPAEVVESVYKQAHFMLLPSKSEGWPKVVAEAMFWGAIPIVTKISCVSWMLGNGERGILLDHDFKKDLELLIQKLSATENLQTMSRNGQLWSHQYTLDDFETEIQKLL